MASKKKADTPPTKRSLSKLSKKKKETKKGSVEGRKDEEEAAGLRTCEEKNETDGSTPTSSKTKKVKKKKKDSKEATKEDEAPHKDDETTKAKKKDAKEKESKTKEVKAKDDETKKGTKRKKSSKGAKKEKTIDEPVLPSTMGGATVFEPVHAVSRPAVTGKDMNEKIKVDIQRLEKEEKESKEKDKQHKEKEEKPKEKTIDEFAPTTFENVNVPMHPADANKKIKKQPKQIICPASASDADAIPSLVEKKPVYLTIPKEDDKGKKVVDEVISSSNTGREKSGKAAEVHDTPEADCKTAVIPATAARVSLYHMVMYNGVPRYEPILTKSGRQLERSEKEVAGKIQILPPGEDPAAKKDGHHPPTTPPSAPSAETAKPAITIGTLPKDNSEPPQEGLSPVSQYIAPYGK